jgi:GWxTD domain-containing protein
MRRLGAFAAGSIFLLASIAPAGTLPDLFQKAKSQIRGEAFTQALQTLAALEAEANKPGNEAAREQLAAPLAFYRGVCEANLGRADEARAQFAAFLSLEPNASMDPSMYSKKALAAFHEARRSGATILPAPAKADAGPSVFQAFQEFRMPANSGEQVNAAWAEGPVRWIMTAEERRRWDQLMPGADWQDFVDHFWQVRNPQPGNPDNVYKTTFERRVAFADANFLSAEGMRGSLTERGMVFVLLGPPTYIGRKPIRSGEDVNDDAGLSRVGSRATAYYQRALAAAGDPAGSTSVATTDAFFGPGARVQETGASFREVWHYRRELLPKSLGFQQVDVEFITRRGYGVGVLQRDPAAVAALDASRNRFVSAP